MPATFIKPALLALAMMPAAALAQDHGRTDTAGPYADFREREIKSLSEQDIEELRRGGGWGLALPAELNGRPGPAHLLELRDELDLTAKQVASITSIYEDMRVAAIAAGERLISAEAALSDAFARPDLDADALRRLVAKAEAARAELRYIHLSRHLATPALLSDAQIRRYNVLRGYTDDPCAKVPEGHDPEAWRRHNGCG